jgi:hypothetical protein
MLDHLPDTLSAELDRLGVYTTGNNNIAVGHEAGVYTTGNNNIAVGHEAGRMLIC